MVHKVALAQAVVQPAVMVQEPNAIIRLRQDRLLIFLLEAKVVMEVVGPEVEAVHLLSDQEVHWLLPVVVVAHFIAVLTGETTVDQG
jgi:hypothetical protein